MTERPTGIRFRDHLAADVPLVIHAWLHANLTNPMVKPVTNRTYFREQRALIARLLEHFGATVVYHKDAPTEILAWICAGRIPEPGFVLHFVYTKKAYRKLGIARDCLAAVGWRIGEVIHATHTTHANDGRFGRYKVEYNPYLLMR